MCCSEGGGVVPLSRFVSSTGQETKSGAPNVVPKGGGCCSGVVLLLFPTVFVCPWVEATKPGAPCVVLGGGGVLFSRGPGGAGPGSVVQKGPGGVIKGRSVPDILTC